MLKKMSRELDGCMDYYLTKIGHLPINARMTASKQLTENQIKGHKSLEINSQELGRHGTLRRTILEAVINEEYERSLKMLKEYLESDSHYPNFRLKTERYILHCIDLIHAIRTKRSFPGISSLTRTKQQELRDKFKEHFKELLVTLKKIESAIDELRLNDVKSTRIVVKSFWLSLVVVFVSGLFIDVVQGLGSTVVLVINDSIEKIVMFLFGS